MIINPALSQQSISWVVMEGGRIVTRRAAIEQPQVAQPTNGSLNIPILSVLNLVASPFVGEGLDLTQTDWEIRTGANGTGTLVFATNGSSIPALTLALATTYYIRVRYRSNDLISLWSDDSVIVTLPL